MKNSTGDKLLFIDTETGGINPNKHSLLSIGLVVWDFRKGILDTLGVFIKYHTYVTTVKAREINKFIKEEHEEVASEPCVAIHKIKAFCNEYFPQNTLIPLAGHNTQFDVSFLKYFLESNGFSYSRMFSYRIIDTYTLLQTLQYAGIIKSSLSSSAKAFKYFNIHVNGRHTALGDAVATAELYSKLLTLIKSSD